MGDLNDKIQNVLVGGNYLIINMDLVKAFGWSAAAWIAYIGYKWKYFNKNNMLDKDGYFYCTREKTSEELRMSTETLKHALVVLENGGFVLVKRVGLPKKNYYKINWEKIVDHVDGMKYTDAINYLEPTCGVKKSPLEGSFKPDKYNNKEEVKTKTKEIIDINSKELISSKNSAEFLPDCPPYNSKPITNSTEEKPYQGYDGKRSRLNRVSSSLILRSKMSLASEKVLPKKFTQGKDAKDVWPILNIWTNLGFRLSRSGTKSFDDTVRSVRLLMCGSYFNQLRGWNAKKFEKYKDRSFSAEEIKEVFQRLKDSTLPDYYPKDISAKEYLKNISISKLIFSDYMGASKFIELWEKPPRKMDSLPEEDPNPVITGKFKRFYRQEVLGGADVTFNSYEEEKFRRGSAKAVEFFEKNSRKFSGVRSIHDYAGIVCGALLKSFSNTRDFEIGHFASDRTYHKIVPAYMYSEALIKSVPKESIYDRVTVED